nr:unnamed protein product [Callosobruchus chinensis]
MERSLFHTKKFTIVRYQNP